MSIYVKVGDDVIIVTGDQIEQGRHAASPISIEVVEEQVRTHRRAGEIRREIRGGPTLGQVAAVADVDPAAHLTVRNAVETIVPLASGPRWRLANESTPRWVQVLGGQVFAELKVEEVAAELNALVSSARVPEQPMPSALVDAGAAWAHAWNRKIAAAPAKPWIGTMGSVSVAGQTTGYAQLPPRELASLREALEGVPPGGASGDAPDWIVRLHRAACEVAGIVVREQPPSAADESRPKAWAESWSRDASGVVTITQVAGTFAERKPPTEVSAIRWTGDNWPTVEAWLADRVEDAKVDPDDASRLIMWDEGGARKGCWSGSWIVQVGSGEIRVLDDEKFNELYAPARLVESDFAIAERLHQEVDRPSSNDVANARLSKSLSELRGSVDALASAVPDQFMAELVEWRRWARGFLKEPELAGLGDDALRRKIVAVLEAPSAIPADLVPRKSGDPVVEACARVGHEVYRVGLADPDMREWDLSPEHERAVVRGAVVAALSGVTPEQWFEQWRVKMREDGWLLGDVKDEARKRHPNLVSSYDKLPEMQRLLDQLFAVAVQATMRAIDELEETYAVPVLKMAGDFPPEQFATFRREWERQVSSAPSAWRTPIVVAPEVLVRRPPNPYTRSGLVSFLDEQIDSMLGAPQIWGTLREVEQQVLLLLEVRGFVSFGHAGVDAVMKAYAGFVTGVALPGCADSAAPLADQLEAAGRASELVGVLRVFVVARRTDPGALPADLKVEHP